MRFLTFFSCTNPKIDDVVPQSPTKELLSRLKTYDLDSPLYKEKEEEPEAVSTSPENTEMLNSDDEKESVISELTDHSDQYYINNGISPECSNKSTDSQLSSASTFKR